MTAGVWCGVPVSLVRHPDGGGLDAADLARLVREHWSIDAHHHILAAKLGHHPVLVEMVEEATADSTIMRPVGQWGWCARPAFGDVQVAGVFDGRGDGGADVARLATPLPVRPLAVSSLIVVPAETLRPPRPRSGQKLAFSRLSPAGAGAYMTGNRAAGVVLAGGWRCWHRPGYGALVISTRAGDVYEFTLKRADAERPERQGYYNGRPHRHLGISAATARKCSAWEQTRPTPTWPLAALEHSSNREHTGRTRSAGGSRHRGPGGDRRGHVRQLHCLPARACGPCHSREYIARSFSFAVDDATGSGAPGVQGP